MRGAHDVGFVFVQLDVAVTAVDGFSGFARHHIGVTIAQQARVSRQSGARTAAKQFVQRQVDALGGNVPQRDVQPGDREYRGPAAAGVVKAAVQVSLNLRNLRGVFADHARRDDLRDGGAGALPAGIGKRLAPASDAFVGFHFDQHGVNIVLGRAAGMRHGVVEHQRGAHEYGFYAGNFHRLVPDWWLG